MAKQRMVLKKVKWNVGKLDNGVEYDYTRLTFDIPIFEGAKNEFGVDSIECEFGSNARAAELMPLKGRLPLEVDVSIYQVSKGGRIVNVVDEVTLVKGN